MSNRNEPPTEPLPTLSRPSFLARMIHRLAVPIILGWLAIAVVLSISVPSLEQVEKDHAVAMNPDAAPSFQATQRMGKLFDESNSGVVAMIVVEGQQPLGEDTHRYYDDLIRQLKADTTHVQHVQDFWGDDMTQAAAQSLDGKATYVQVALTDPRQGVSANQSVEAVRGIVDRDSSPAGSQGLCHRPGRIRRGSGARG